MRDTHEQFSSLTVSLHWLIGIGVIIMLAFGVYIEDLPRSPEKGQLIGIHKSLGMLIFLLALIRIFWRYINKFPIPLSEIQGWQKTLANLAHWVLIIGTVLMPVSGVIMSIGGGHPVGIFGLELIAGTGEEKKILGKIGHIMHGLGGKLFILFVILHFVGAVKHQLIDKDGTMQRMLGKRVDSS